MGLFRSKKARATTQREAKPVAATLLPGQSHGASCPYLWNFCNNGSCDGCQADAEQASGSQGAPWVQGTTAEERHHMVREAAEGRGGLTMSDLMDGGFRRR